MLHGVFINSLTIQKYSPFLLAAWFGHLDIVEYLFENGADINLVDAYECTALHRACQSCNNDIVEFLLDNGANPNLPNKDGPPLHIACTVGDFETLKQLVAHDADIHAMFKGKSVLHLAVINFRIDIMTYLLDNGADLNQKDAQGNTCLHLAAWLTLEKVVKILIERGAIIDAENNLLETPLQRAAEIGSGSIFEILLNAGADILKKDKIQRTPIDWAKAMGHESVLETYQKIEDKKAELERLANRPLILSESSDTSMSFNLSCSSFSDVGRTPSSHYLHPTLNPNEPIMHESIIEDGNEK